MAAIVSEHRREAAAGRVPHVVHRYAHGRHAVPTAAELRPDAPPPREHAGGGQRRGATGATGAAVDAGRRTRNDLCAALVPPGGTVTMNGVAPDLPAVAALLDSLKADTDLTTLWVTTAKAGDRRAASSRSRSPRHSVRPARGHRLETFFKGAKCK